MGLAARVVTRSGRARPVCDSGRGPGPESPGQSPRGAVRGSRRRLGAVARGRGATRIRRARGPGRRGLACGERGGPDGGDAELAGAELSAEPGRCAGALAPQLRPPACPPAARGLGPGKLCPRGTEQRLGGGGSGRGRPAGRRPSAVCFFSLPAAAAGDEEEDGGAEAELPRPPGVTVRPVGISRSPFPPRARAMRAP